MTVGMLDYSKFILEKVSFDENLFEKELRKSIRNLEEKDLPHLKSWCHTNFCDLYPQLIEKVFDEVVTEKFI